MLSVVKGQLMYPYLRYEEPVFRPPSEAKSLILQITVGCSQNQCRFCGMYKMKKFRCRPVEELTAEITQLPEALKAHVRRVFLADGDALVYSQGGLVEILNTLNHQLPNLTRVGTYASPRSLTGKSEEDLRALFEKKLKIIYFGLESGDDETLKLADKQYGSQQMLELCKKARRAGLKISVTAILGLAGSARTKEHAKATAEWVNALSPEYFSLLTMFRRHNDDYFKMIEPLTNGQVLEEALAIVSKLQPERTILRSNHVSNILNLSGSYPKDRLRLISHAEMALAEGRKNPSWFNQIPGYGEEYY